MKIDAPLLHAATSGPQRTEGVRRLAKALGLQRRIVARLTRAELCTVVAAALVDGDERLTVDESLEQARGIIERASA